MIGWVKPHSSLLHTIEGITRDQDVKFSEEKERFPGDTITSKKIKKLWLTKFAADKYDRRHPNLSEEGKKYKNQDYRAQSIFRDSRINSKKMAGAFARGLSNWVRREKRRTRLG